MRAQSTYSYGTEIWLTSHGSGDGGANSNRGGGCGKCGPYYLHNNTEVITIVWIFTYFYVLCILGIHTVKKIIIKVYEFNPYSASGAFLTLFLQT